MDKIIINMIKQLKRLRKKVNNNDYDSVDIIKSLDLLEKKLNNVTTMLENK